MSERLWFLSLNDEIVGVFDDYDIAVEEKDFLQEENHKDDVVLRKKFLRKLEKYTDEYDMARERGYIK
ncbi:hypothetical protein [Spirochaeta isovalerica]|uniref:Uncharacterized protein n=1 Tax=Spirochaeta isovalerica TaxID=150 RepID=A0A841R1M1_9SPIO|nr:hypothetical protein [Spirochaeta isovalerica]MBB6478894.1 hypothetical protein [Spirochaeta isovalerica]